jgi:hypothetical protein
MKKPKLKERSDHVILNRVSNSIKSKVKDY